MQLLCFYIEHNSDSKGLCSFRLKWIPSERVIVSALNIGQRNFGTINYFEFWVGVFGNMTLTMSICLIFCCHNHSLRIFITFWLFGSRKLCCWGKTIWFSWWKYCCDFVTQRVCYAAPRGTSSFCLLPQIASFYFFHPFSNISTSEPTDSLKSRKKVCYRHWHQHHHSRLINLISFDLFMQLAILI